MSGGTRGSKGKKSERVVAELSENQGIMATADNDPVNNAGTVATMASNKEALTLKDLYSLMVDTKNDVKAVDCKIVSLQSTLR